MSPVIRHARAADHPRLAAIAAEGDSTDADSEYLSFVASAGRLLVAELGAGDEREAAGQPVAFGGMVPDEATGAAMVTDLFVGAAARGQGVGSALLAELLQGHTRRMTCSSKHPAALPVYQRAGMTPRWRLLYLRGWATGGGPPMEAGEWAHGRREVVGYFASRGAVVCPDVVVQVDADEAMVHRLCSERPAEVMATVLAALPAGLPVELCVPEHHPLAPWLLAEGFQIVDHDVLCSTAGVDLHPALGCVHPGLC